MTLAATLAPASDDRPLVALHSSGGSGRHWATLARRFAPDRQVVTPDFHAHGSGPGWQGAPENIAAADVRLVLDWLERLDGAHVVGHSYGGAIALAAAIARPDLVHSLVVYEPVAFGLLLDYNPRHTAAIEIASIGSAIGNRVRRGDLGGAASRFITYWSGVGAWDALPPEHRATMAARMPAIHGHFRSLLVQPMRVSSLRALAMPLLVVTSDAPHRPVARVCELIRFGVPHAGFVTLAHAAHMTPVTDASRFADVVEDFHREHGFVARREPMPAAA